MGLEGVTMVDILVDAQFQLGMATMVLILLILATTIPTLTRSPERPPQQREWRVVEPAEQITTVEAKRIEARHGN